MGSIKNDSPIKRRWVNYFKKGLLSTFLLLIALQSGCVEVIPVVDSPLDVLGDVPENLIEDTPSSDELVEVIIPESDLPNMPDMSQETGSYVENNSSGGNEAGGAESQLMIDEQSVPDMSLDPLTEESIPVPASIAIVSGPDEIKQGDTGTYVVIATYKDGATKNITNNCVWSIIGGRASFIGIGVLAPSSEVTTDEQVSILIQYKENDVSLEIHKDILIRHTNGAPMIQQGTSLKVSVDQNSQSNDVKNQIALTANDLNLNSLTWKILETNVPAHGVVTILSGETGVTGQNVIIAYTPEANYLGSDEFIVTVDDGAGGQDAILINVLVGVYEIAGNVTRASDGASPGEGMNIQVHFSGITGGQQHTQTVTADAIGKYSLLVPNNVSGTINLDANNRVNWVLTLSEDQNDSSQPMG